MLRKNTVIESSSQLWGGLASISIKTLSNVLAAKDPGGCWDLKGDYLLGRCLSKSHTDNHPSMRMSPSRKEIRCLACGYKENSVVAFFRSISDRNSALANDGPTGSSVLSFFVSLGIQLSGRYQDSLHNDLATHKSRWLINLAMNNLLQDALVHYYDEEFNYCRAAVRLLVSRHVFPNQGHIASQPLGIFPTRFHLNKYLGGIPGENAKELLGLMTMLGDENFTSDVNYLSTHTGWLSFTYYTDFSSIGGFKLRSPDKKDFRWVGHRTAGDADAPEKPKGLFGLNTCSNVLKVADDTVDFSITPDKHGGRVYVLEGEFDVLSCKRAQADRDPRAPRAFVGASGGGMDSDIDYLAECGIEYISVIGDNDNGGENFTCRVLEATSLKAAVFNWKESSALREFAQLLGETDEAKVGADPDDLLNAGFGTEFLADIDTLTSWKDRNSWFLDSVSAARDRFTKTKKPGDTPKDIDKQAIDAYVGAIAKVDDSDRLSIFHQLTAEAYDTTSVAKAFVYGRDDDEAIISMLQLAISTHITPLMRDGLIYYFCKTEHNEIIEIEPNKRAAVVANTIEVMLANATGYHLIQWARTLSLPERVFKTVKTIKGELLYTDKSMSSIRKELDLYVKSALIHMCKSDACPPVYSLDRSGGGFYYYGWKKAHLRDSIYIVNGRNICKGLFPIEEPPEPNTDIYSLESNTGIHLPSTKETLVKYTDLKVPAENGVIFNVDSREWSASINTGALNTPYTKLTPLELYDTLVGIINIGWSFRSKDGSDAFTKSTQELTCQYLAAWIMSAAVLTLFETRNQTYITAEPSSGKTTLLESLISPKGEIRLLESSQFYSEYTTAAVLQGITNRAVPLLLDEFEAATIGNKNRGLITRALLEALRANYKGEVVSIRGTKEQKQRERSFSAACLFAGITPPFNDSADRSRWIILNLVREKDRSGPIDLIKAAYSDSEIDTVREGINIMLPQRSNRILQAYKWCRRHKGRYSTPSNTPRDRYTSLMLPIYSILRWVGIDPIKFSAAFAKMQDGTSPTRTAQEDFKGMIFTTPCKALQPRDEHLATETWISAHLKDRQGREKLESAHIGAYYHADYRAVVLYLPHVRVKVLREAEYEVPKAMTNEILLRKLREQGAWPNSKVKRADIYKWSTKKIGIKVNRDDIAVFNTEDIIGKGATTDFLDTTDYEEEVEYVGKKKRKTRNRGAKVTKDPDIDDMMF